MQGSTGVGIAHGNWKLSVFRARLEEPMRPREVMTPEVRGEPACAQIGQSPVCSFHLSGWWTALWPSERQDVIVDLVATGEPLWGPARWGRGCCHRLWGVRSQLGLPARLQLQWKSLPTWDLRCSHRLHGELPLHILGGG